MSGSAQDRQDLRRGVLVNAVGVVLRAANPILLVVIIRTYGMEAFGTFGVLEAVVFLAVRVSLGGLDKGLLWWVAQQEPEHERLGLRPTLTFVAVSSTVIALLIASAGAPLIAAWKEQSPHAVLELRLIAAAIPPLALTEILLHVTLAKRRMEAQIVVREIVLSFSFLGGALALPAFGYENVGLPLAYVVSSVLGLFGSAIAMELVLKGSRWPEGDRLPRALLKYSLPVWSSEVLNTLLQRIDTFVLGAFADARAVGIYEAAKRLARVMQMIRRSFDPIVLAIMSTHGLKDSIKLANALSHATTLVLFTQTPVLIVLLLWMDPLVAVLGGGYSDAAGPALIFSWAFFVSGGLGFNGLVALGAGRSDLTLFNTLGTLALQLVLLFLLVPPLGVLGAAAAHGIAVAGQTVLQLFEVRSIARRWLYTSEAKRAMVLCAIALLSAALLFTVVRGEAGSVLGTLVGSSVVAWGVWRNTSKAPRT